MRKNMFLYLIIAVIGCGEASERKTETDAHQASALTYVKGDLKKIKWIEGKWKGLYNGEPFYEFYRFSNDSTLEITSFDWDGKDSSKTSISYVHYKDGVYYLGDKQNYKVSSITDTEITMLRNVEANNDILWKYRDSTGWDAILTSPNKKVVYNMEYYDPFKR